MKAVEERRLMSISPRVRSRMGRLFIFARLSACRFDAIFSTFRRTRPVTSVRTARCGHTHRRTLATGGCRQQ